MLGHPLGCIFQPTLHRGIILITANKGAEGYTGLVLNKKIHLTLEEYLEYCGVEDDPWHDRAAVLRSDHVNSGQTGATTLPAESRSGGGSSAAAKVSSAARGGLRQRRKAFGKFSFARGGDLKHTNDVQILHTCGDVRGGRLIYKGGSEEDDGLCLYLDGDLGDILEHCDPKTTRVFGGHCIWGQGQLETEIER